MIEFFKSTIGKKILVAFTGLVLFGFIIGHLIGNLLVFQGPESFNAYAEFLKNSPKLLWGTRIALLGSVVIHIVLTFQLTIRNRRSRPLRYAEFKPQSSSISSRLMVISGLFLLLYIIYHLLHFTVGTTHTNFIPHDVYRNVITDFSHFWITSIYVVAMICLGFHLHHGIWSVFQTLGLNHEKYNAARRWLATSAAILIPIGYSIIPLAVLMGFLK